MKGLYVNKDCYKTIKNKRNAMLCIYQTIESFEEFLFTL